MESTSRVPSSTPHARPCFRFRFRLCLRSGATPRAVRNPFEQLTRLHVERRTQPVERVGGEPTELQVRVCKTVGGWYGEAGLLGEPVGRPSLSFEDGCEMKANHGRWRLGGNANSYLWQD